GQNPPSATDFGRKLWLFELDSFCLRLLLRKLALLRISFFLRCRIRNRLRCAALMMSYIHFAFSRQAMSDRMDVEIFARRANSRVKLLFCRPGLSIWSAI